MALASAFPQTPEELLQIVGIGERKAEVYGEAILLPSVTTFSSTARRLVRISAPAEWSGRGRKKFHLVGEEFANGKSIAICRRS